MKHIYLFHLGKTPELSLAEITTVFKDKIEILDLIDKSILKVESHLNKEDLRLQLRKMGGIKKISELLKLIPNNIDINNFTTELAEVVTLNFFSLKVKCNLGLNTYGRKLPLRKIGFEIKRIVQNEGIKLRIVETPEDTLNSVSIIRNKLLKDKGFDLNIIQDKEDILISKTVACQNSLSYSKRDYDRPRRNAKVGMMPPKLCQMMLSLAELKDNDLFLDPFCGLGTIPQEAMLNRINFRASDINQNILNDCTENLEWLVENYRYIIDSYKKEYIQKSDARKIGDTFKNNKFDAIVTEGYLGPAQNRFIKEDDIYKIFQDIGDIYVDFFTTASNILKKEARIVISFPVFKSQRKELIYFSDYFAPILEKNWENIKILEKNLNKNISLLQSISSRLIYERPDQIVLREIMILESKNLDN